MPDRRSRTTSRIASGSSPSSDSARISSGDSSPRGDSTAAAAVPRFTNTNPAGSIPQRTTTTVAPQALFLMNGPFPRDAAKKLVASAKVQKATDPAERLDVVFQIILGRKPDAEERKLALAFVAKGPERWVDLAHGLMMTNEFAFVD